ncbi:MAG: hypothetical protein ACYTGL_01810 [Planctomycetota bacterium]|jgi:hypothetical protein
MAMPQRLSAVVVLTATASLSMLWLTGIPLGIPDEWTWTRIPADAFAGDIVVGIVQAVIAAAVFLLLAWAGARRVSDCSRIELSGWLAGMTAVSWLWLFTVQEFPPTPWNNGKAAFVVYYPGISGYFHKARYEIDDARAFLSGYEDLMAEGDVLHVGTHPPGLFLLYQGLISLTDRSATIRSLADATMPQSVVDSLETVTLNARATGSVLTESDHATIWLAAFLTQCACASVVIPLFGLMRLNSSRIAAWQSIAFWPLLPALAVFLPKSDVLFTLPAVSLVLVWLLAVRRRSWLLGAVAGLIGWLCLLLSLAFLPIGLIAVLCGAASLLEQRRADLSEARKPLWNSLTQPVAGGIIAFVALTIGLAVLADVNLANVWLQNYQNHAGFYAQFQRTWWKWLLVNPIELTFACGAPIAVLGLMSLRRTVLDDQQTTGRLQTLAVVAVWALLWLSGKNSGEAARLWIPLLPMLIWTIAHTFGQRQHNEGPTDTSTSRLWLTVLTTQLAVSALTVVSVSGFHFN